MKTLVRSAITLLLTGLATRAAVTVVQNSGPGATSWPPTPIISTMPNPSSANTTQTFTNVLAGTTNNPSNFSQTFTITSTNYILQSILIYAGGGTGTGAGTNITLNLYDLGFQVAPNPTPYNRIGYKDILGGNLFGSGSGLPINYANQANGILEFDFSGSDQVLLQNGHMYVFELAGVAATTPLNWLSVVNSSPYAAGAAYKNQDWLNFTSTSSTEFAMAIYANVSTMPPPTPPTQTGTCTVNWTNVAQRIDGFGASSAFAGTGFSTAQYDMLFSTNTGIGLSLLRNQVQAGGFATAAELSIMTNAQSRGARIWSAPWSPQSSFKVPQVANGGNYAGNGGDATNLAYASQLASYAVTLKNKGFNLYGLSIQNEPDTTNTTYPTCWWTTNQIHDFATNLYAALVAKNVASTKIMLPESTHWSSSLYASVMNDTNVASVVGIIANHNYDGDPATTTPAALPNYGKALWETEVAILNPSGSTDSSIQNGVFWAGRVHSFLTVAQANAYHYWWLIYGNSSPNQGLTDINKNTLAKRGYALGNFSRFVRPNYNRIGVVTNSGAALVSAYKDPNSGTFAVVAINRNITNDINQTFNLNNFVTASVTPWITSGTLSLASQTSVPVGGPSFNYTLPALSIVTFVGQGNSPPILAQVPTQTIQPGRQLSVTNIATDPDAPPQLLSFTLLNAPGSATLDANTGVLTWTPLMADADSTNLITVVVTDNGNPQLSATNSFNVIVTPFTNTAPTLAAVPDQTINAGVSLVVTNAATDPDVPALQTLTFTLLSAPANATLDTSSGIFTWRPLVSQAGSVNPITVEVADNGQPPLSATNNFTITVNPLSPTVLTSLAASGGQVSFSVDGPQGPDYTVLTSTNLTDWQLFFTTNSPALPFTLIDSTTNADVRFYRIQLGP